MGGGHNSLRKTIKKETIYIDKKISKHKHNFVKRYILKIENTNFNSTSYSYMHNRYITYYNVLKCDKCNSFKSIGESGNCQGHIFDESILNNNKLPVITAKTNSKFLITNFDSLKDISLEDN